jgi:hypothetical protein
VIGGAEVRARGLLPAHDQLAGLEARTLGGVESWQVVRAVGGQEQATAGSQYEVELA